jgi:hypothetical protein
MMLTISVKKFLMLFSGKLNRCRSHATKRFCFLVEFQVICNIFLLTISASNDIRYTHTPQETILFCCWIHLRLSGGIYIYSLLKCTLCYSWRWELKQSYRYTACVDLLSFHLSYPVGSRVMLLSQFYWTSSTCMCWKWKIPPKSS